VTLHATEPREDFVAERVEHFQLVIVSISDKNHILLRDEVHSERMLQFGIIADTVLISEAMQVLGVVVCTNNIARARESLHVDSTNGG